MQKLMDLIMLSHFYILRVLNDDPGGRKVQGVGMRPLGCWDLCSNPGGGWMFVCCECCVLLGRGLCDRPITRPEESCRVWCV